MITVNLQVRPAVVADKQKIADLIFLETRVHRHLDWRTPLEWLGHSPYFVLEENGKLSAALACPVDPDPIAWIRLFVQTSHHSELSAWSPLWQAVLRQWAGQGQKVVAAIATQRWFEHVLLASGFTLAQRIVLLEWNEQVFTPPPLPSGITIRPMSFHELPAVVDVDASAFEPLWRNSVDALTKAFSQAAYASVAEDARGMVGYQLSTGNPPGAHLARLAVRPDAQGRGIGAALVGDLIQRIRRSGGTRITVNTQNTNSASLALYQRLGFVRTGEQYPVYTFQVK